jgi:hypothetical protein
MRRALGSRSRIVTVEDGAHVVGFSQINTCADELATAFFVSGTLPRDTFCRRDAEPAGGARSDGAAGARGEEVGLLSAP